MDFNIAKFEIPIHIRKAFDKGKIGEVCRGIYALAYEIATSETENRFKATKPSELLEGPTKVINETSTYKQQRTEYWFGKMLQVLELYAKSKSGKSN